MAGRHGAGGPGPPPPSSPDGLATATTAHAGAAPAAAASGAGGCSTPLSGWKPMCKWRSVHPPAALPGGCLPVPARLGG